ncbi:pyridine nucleotide-disulfide oxidoreductase [Chloropicon primus]|uniref:Pyridine nucleotide-disulfide oxidoreductase n=1 Tax=Chloropicon primus TaxID=1764295 RepID=A0A5B8MG72_9CHLO|nr:pyridine nucleotide-disulfide oxidoreductase [Chloropicon primus]|mmetsp:Transcript_8460/g.24181  ORF Transcript_8460/g.24181 Transcript_8460/m.24181 type:complete len:536 (+) Transcript_8460:76-1683(+)|eukprot:QDZ19668.1 pyridine nucleotide-disulfide oxidoreductase [Chloropicon primus]
MGATTSLCGLLGSRREPLGGDAVAPEREICCDYLVVGAGASSLAFVDTLVEEMPSVRVCIVEKREAPGGHWNDAYDFVRLHQPSLFYGLPSRQLEGNWLLSFLKFQKPWFHRATKQEILRHYRAGVRSWSRAGRAQFYGNCEYDFARTPKSADGTHYFTSLDTGEEYSVKVSKKLVNGVEYEPLIPSKCPLPFPVDKEVTVLTPNDLPATRKRHPHYVVLGCGKTGMDTVIYLQRKLGVDPKDITLLVPNDVWIYDRYPRVPSRGPWDFVHKYLECDGDFPRTCLAMEAQGLFLRFDETRMPTVLRHPIIDKKELALLRRVNMVRRGRVSSIKLGVGKRSILLKFGSDYLPMTFRENTAFVNCCSPGPFNGHRASLNSEDVDIFDSKSLITLYIIFTPPASLPSSAIAFLEAGLQKGTIDLEFGRDLLEDSSLEPTEVLRRLFHPWPIMSKNLKGVVNPILNMALFLALAHRDCREVLRWLRSSRLSLFSMPMYKSGLWDAVNMMLEKKGNLGLTDKEERILRKLVAKLEPLRAV